MAEACEYMSDVFEMARIIEASFGPVKTNYEILANFNPHMHTLIIPRYADDPTPEANYLIPKTPPLIPVEEFERDAAILRRASRAQD
jgi:diadenosine tetraphosphate (Ap4A) HIT family hydrolase